MWLSVPASAIFETLTTGLNGCSSSFLHGSSCYDFSFSFICIKGISNYSLQLECLWERGGCLSLFPTNVLRPFFYIRDVWKIPVNSLISRSLQNKHFHWIKSPYNSIITVHSIDWYPRNQISFFVNGGNCKLLTTSHHTVLVTEVHCHSAWLQWRLDFVKKIKIRLS